MVISLQGSMAIIRARATNALELILSAAPLESQDGENARQWSAGILSGILGVIDDYEGTLPHRPASVRPAQADGVVE